MELSTTEFNQAKSKMASDIKTVVADGENLLKAAANVSSSGFAVVREKVGEQLCNAKGKLLEASRPSIERARRTAAVANDYVHVNPWAVIGVAVAASALVGFWAAKR